MNLSEEAQKRIENLLINVMKAIFVIALVGVASYLGVDVRVDQMLDAVGQDAVVELGVTNFDTLQLSAELTVSPRSAITVTNGNPFTPTGTYQPITAAGPVTPTVAVGNAGDVVVLINTGANAITLADAGTAKLSAAAVLGQFDSIILWSDGTNWIEVSRSDN